MNRTEFLPLAHKAAAVESAAVPEFLPELAAVEVSNPPAWAGMIVGLSLKHPAELLGDDLARAKELDPDGPYGADVALALWAVTGALPPLAELVRRAVNRDGSAVADAVSMDAIALISEAEKVDLLFMEALSANNFRLSSMRFGSHPLGSFSLPLPGPAARVGSGISRTTRAATAPAPAAAAPPPARPVARRPLSDHEAATVRAGQDSGNGVAADHQTGKIQVAGVVLSISDGVKLRDSITTAVTELLRPAEGYSWLDDTMDPHSRAVLIDLDNVRGAGLPEASGGFLHGEVIQIPSRGPDENAGKYLGRVYNRAGGFNEFATDTDDMNAAKFTVAERVRVELSNQ